MPQNFGVTRAELPFALYSAIRPTHIIKTLVNAAMYSAIAIELLVGVTVLSVGVFGAIAYALASSKAKDKDSKYGHLYPVSSQGFSTGIYA